MNYKSLIGKLAIGVLAGTILGMYITSFFMTPGIKWFALFWTKITAPTIATGFCCALYAHFSRSKFQIFVISVLIGIIIFYLKYLITGHNFDPIIMGAFSGAILGGLMSLIRKIEQSIKGRRRLKSMRKKGFSNYY